MAFLSNVQTALQQKLVSIIYPAGVSGPTATSPVTSCIVTVIEGWPLPAALDAALSAGAAFVSVYARPGEDRSTTRYSNDWQENTLPAPGVTVAISGQTLTIGGAATVGNIVCPIIGNAAYPYVVTTGATLNSIATGVAALIAVDYPGAAAVGPVITVPDAGIIKSARVGVTGTALRPIRTAEQVFQITVWAPNPTIRAKAVNAIDAVLSDIKRMPMLDGSTAIIKYKQQRQSDSQEKVNLYRNDLMYTVEYTVVESQVFTQVLANILNIVVQGGSIPSTITSVNAGVVNINGTQQGRLYIGPTAPTDSTPWFWLKTDKPLNDPSHKVILLQEGP